MARLIAERKSLKIHEKSIMNYEQCANVMKVNTDEENENEKE